MDDTSGDDFESIKHSRQPEARQSNKKQKISLAAKSSFTQSSSTKTKQQTDIQSFFKKLDSIPSRIPLGPIVNAASSSLSQPHLKSSSPSTKTFITSAFSLSNTVSSPIVARKSTYPLVESNQNAARDGQQQQRLLINKKKESASLMTFSRQSSPSETKTISAAKHQSESVKKTLDTRQPLSTIINGTLSWPNAVQSKTLSSATKSRLASCNASARPPTKSAAVVDIDSDDDFEEPRLNKFIKARPKKTDLSKQSSSSSASYLSIVPKSSNQQTNDETSNKKRVESTQLASTSLRDLPRYNQQLSNQELFNKELSSNKDYAQVYCDSDSDGENEMSDDCSRSSNYNKADSRNEHNSDFEVEDEASSDSASGKNNKDSNEEFTSFELDPAVKRKRLSSSASIIPSTVAKKRIVNLLESEELDDENTLTTFVTVDVPKRRPNNE
ncbi:UNVERIFIED_CONTAM: hypothetical protein HDU68_003001, partial [Siphonaria sp. JEL0065]